MELEVKKLIYDLDQAIELIINFTSGKRLADYQGNVLLLKFIDVTQWVKVPPDKSLVSRLVVNPAGKPGNWRPEPR